MPDHHAVYKDLVKLRRGPGLQATVLGDRVGPGLSAVCGVSAGDDDRLVRRKLTAEIKRVASELPPELKLAAEAAFAIDRRAMLHRLADREQWLAGKLGCSPRNARRRVTQASARLAEALQEQSHQQSPTDPEQGWQLRRLRALLCLDTPTPELYEERTIVAVRDALTEISARSSVPRRPDDHSPGHDLHADILHGVRLMDLERLGETHFRFILGLPKPLSRGEELTYLMRYRIPHGQPMRPHYAFVPLIPCESFQLRVRFDPERPPPVAWRLDKVAQRLLDEPLSRYARLELDGGHELTLEFTDLAQGYGYGVGWQPPDPGPPPGSADG